MKKFVVVWREIRYVAVVARDEEQALEKFYAGKFKKRDVEIHEGPDDVCVERV